MATRKRPINTRIEISNIPGRWNDNASTVSKHFLSVEAAWQSIKGVDGLTQVPKSLRFPVKAELFTNKPFIPWVLLWIEKKSR